MNATAALAVVRDELRVWEAERRVELGYVYVPLLQLPFGDRVARVAATGLHACGLIGALLADALGDDGIVSRELYHSWLGGCDPAYLVENLLPRGTEQDRRISAAVRREVYERDGKHCQLAYLGGCVGTTVALDHFVPWVWGGPSSADNLWPLCQDGHNMAKLAQWPRQHLLDAWLDSETRRSLPDCYHELLKRRTWGEIEWDREHQTWQDELGSIRRRQQRERRARKRA